MNIVKTMEMIKDVLDAGVVNGRERQRETSSSGSEATMHAAGLNVVPQVLAAGYGTVVAKRVRYKKLQDFGMFKGLVTQQNKGEGSLEEE